MYTSHLDVLPIQQIDGFVLPWMSASTGLAVHGKFLEQPFVFSQPAETSHCSQQLKNTKQQPLCRISCVLVVAFIQGRAPVVGASRVGSMARSHVLLVRFTFEASTHYTSSMVWTAGVGGNGGNGGNVHQQSYTTQSGDHNSGKAPVSTCLSGRWWRCLIAW